METFRETPQRHHRDFTDSTETLRRYCRVQSDSPDTLQRLDKDSTEILQRLYRVSTETLQNLYRDRESTNILQRLVRDSTEAPQRLVRDPPEIVQRERARESHSKAISEIDVAFCTLWQAGNSRCWVLYAVRVSCWDNSVKLIFLGTMFRKFQFILFCLFNRLGAICNSKIWNLDACIMPVQSNMLST